MEFVNKIKNKIIFLPFAVMLLITAVVGHNLEQSTVATVAEPYYNGVTGQNKIAITVNVDWGEEYIPKMLEIFKKRNVKATFFLTGRWTENCPDVAAEILDSGMEIGNHGLKHLSPNAMTYDENVADIKAAETIIKDTLGVETTLFAPPSGEIEEQVLQAADDLGYEIILWSADTIDWQKPDVATILSRMEEKTDDGGIILMHPTENTVAALNGIVDILERKNLTVVPVSELIEEK